MSGLLAGVRVLDLTNVLAGPFCGYQLAQLGADVIKVEVPGSGDLARQLGADLDLNHCFMGASFLAQNAGKRSITLNLKSEEGKALFHRLVATADVVLENFRPGVMDRLGLGYDTLRETRPALVYCAISGFGQDGPLAKSPAYDQIIQGYSGIMSITGDPETAPWRVGYPVCDTIGGITAAFAISAALVRRAISGTGAFIDVSMLEATLVTMGWQVSNYLIAGQQPVPMGNDNMTASPSGTFRTGDGLLNIAANRQQQFEGLCHVLGRPDLPDDPRFADRESRKSNRSALSAEIETALQSDSAAHWEARLNQAGVPSGRVLSIPEALAHEQVETRGLIKRFPYVEGVGRDVAVMRSGFQLAEDEPAPMAPPPELGQDTDAILADLGLSAQEIDDLRRRDVV